MKIFLIGIMLLTLNLFAKTYEVKMLNSKGTQSMIFDPSHLNIKIGDKVKFVPTDAGHNSQSIFIPEKATSWKSENGEEFTITFDREGIFIYECNNHKLMGMLGIIQVDKAINLDTANDFYQKYKKKLIMNKDRLDEYLK